MTLLLSIAVGLSGVLAGAYLARRNARHAHADKLLADTLNDLMTAIADVVAREPGAQRRYASAISRLALYGSPDVVELFAEFQRDATTLTHDGQQRFLDALQVARHELGRPDVDRDAAMVLLFGSRDHMVVAECVVLGEQMPGRPGLGLRDRYQHGLR